MIVGSSRRHPPPESLKLSRIIGATLMASSKQVVGNPTPRVEGETKVNGKAKYAVDVVLPGMLWGKLLRSPIASGKIKRIDTSKASALAGVRAIVTGADCAGLKIGRRVYDMPIL